MVRVACRTVVRGSWSGVLEGACAELWRDVMHVLGLD